MNNFNFNYGSLDTISWTGQHKDRFTTYASFLDFFLLLVPFDIIYIILYNNTSPNWTSWFSLRVQRHGWHRFFFIRVQRHGWHHENPKNLAYFIKQIENRFRVSATWKISKTLSHPSCFHWGFSSWNDVIQFCITTQILKQFPNC